jgi:endonuclease YncB( thermonuclease family)
MACEGEMKNFSKFRLLPIVLFMAFSLPSPGFAWSGKVVSISDGDTIRVLHNGKEKEIRLYGIDTPEIGQAFGQKAKDLTSALVAGRKIEVQQKDIDSYGRTVALVFVDGNNLNELIVKNGSAWVYKQYCKENFCANWSRLQAKAREQKKGLWSVANSIPPWEWRHQNRQTATATKPPEIIIGQSVNPTSTGSRSAGRYQCDGRIYCSQMTSCQEAKFFINNCPGTKMDGNNDGIPCERQWCN